LKEGYKQDTKLAFIVKAIYTLAHGLHLMQSEICGDPQLGYCPDMKPFNGKLYKEYLKKGIFKYQDEIVQFDANGDPPGRYDIMNFQKTGNSTDYVLIGSWNNGTLLLNRQEQYHPRSTTFAPVFESVCSKPCNIGEYKHFQDGAECCWTCVSCREEEFLFNETSCRACLRGWWPTANKTDCERIPVESLEWNQPQAILVMIIASIGLILTGVSTVVFIQHNNTPVVKSSSRELSYTILFGCSLAFLTTFPLIQRPNHFSCLLSRILPGTSIAFIYAALATKTNRIARILAVKKMITARPRFMSSGAQLVLVSGFIMIEALAVVLSIFLISPIPMIYYPSTTRVKLVCHNNWKGMIIPFGFDFVLLFICTGYAVKTRNVPENFNEAKFIGFSCYTTCVIWLSYIPIWFGSDIQVIATSVCLSLSAYVTLALQFLPKLYIILCQPHKNNRSMFTTAVDVRCHIGPGVFSAPSSSKSKGGQSLSRDLPSEPSSQRLNGVAHPVMSGPSPKADYSGGSEVLIESRPVTASQLKPGSQSQFEELKVQRTNLEMISNSSRVLVPRARTMSQTGEIRLFCTNCMKVYPHGEPNNILLPELNQTCGNNKVHRPTFTQNRINEPNKTISKEKYNPSKTLSMSSTTLPEKQSQSLEYDKHILQKTVKCRHNHTAVNSELVKSAVNSELVKSAVNSELVKSAVSSELAKSAGNQSAAKSDPPEVLIKSTKNRLSIIEENTFAGNNDIKNIIICINTPDIWC